MKINLWRPLALRRAEWIKRISKWHDWFAWHPVRVGLTEWRWLETIERRGEPCQWFPNDLRCWHYRKKK